MTEKASTQGLHSASDTIKQIITLATAMIGLTVTFAKEFKPDNTDLSVPWTLQASWAAYLISVIFGVMVLMAITGTLNECDKTKKAGDTNSSNIRIPAAICILSFLIALIFTAISTSSIMVLN